MSKSILSLDPEHYVQHRIHTQERDWAETNCYVDIWIELLHSLGYEPIAAMPYTIAIDFEGDQWTFFKFPLGDLLQLFALDVQELALWLPLTKHIEGQVALGRPVLVELDSYFLPDTIGTAYQQAHVKSTVAVIEIDVEKKHLGYFHGQGYYHLSGEDFTNVFNMNEGENSSILPPYVEIVKRRNTDKLTGNDLLKTSLILFKRQLALLPLENPFTAFKKKFERDLQWLLEKDLDMFHQYSFATFRQYGSCFELSSIYLQWLSEQGEEGLSVARKNLKNISEIAKVYQFQLARSIMRKKPLDLTPIDEMSALWLEAMNVLREKYL